MPLLRPLSWIALLGAAACAETPPPTSPRPRAFQQFCEQALSVPQASAMAVARGAEGFELVAMYNGVLCYKRPAPEGAPSHPAAAVPAAPAPASTFVPAVRDPGF